MADGSSSSSRGNMDMLVHHGAFTNKGAATDHINVPDHFYRTAGLGEESGDNVWKGSGTGPVQIGALI
jgi:hypothetical protein